jgi:KaiC/GvpD/RAD55 family RecA-like ATPase
MTASKPSDRIPASQGTRGTGVKSADKGPTWAPISGVNEPVPDTDSTPAPDIAPTNSSKTHPFGIRRLDELISGGLKFQSSALLYGPPYIGKEHLGRSYALHAMRSGIPAIFIDTLHTATEITDILLEMDSAMADYVKSGLIHIIDCYSRNIEAEDLKMSHISYVDGAMDLNGISVALNRAQRKMQSSAPNHVVVLDSLSTVTTYSDPKTAFRFLQILIGKSKLIGGSSIITLDEGMHADADVKMFSHLVDGIIEVHDHIGKFQLQARGLTAPTGVGWIDYRYAQSQFELTGSFAPGRIR